MYFSVELRRTRPLNIITTLYNFKMNSATHTFYYVYILQCKDESHYVGCTNSLESRLLHHQRGYNHYTKSRRPVNLQTCIAFTDKQKAYEFERYLKSGSGRAFMYKRLV